MDTSMVKGCEVSGYDAIRMPMDRSVKISVRVEIQEDRIICTTYRARAIGLGFLQSPNCRLRAAFYV